MKETAPVVTGSQKQRLVIAPGDDDRLTEHGYGMKASYPPTLQNLEHSSPTEVLRPLFNNQWNLEGSGKDKTNLFGLL